MKMIKLVPLLCITTMFSFVLLAENAKKTYEDYIKDLNSGDPYLQSEACRYLGKKKETSAIESLIFLLEDEKVDRYVKVSAVNALSFIGEKEGVMNAILKSAQESKNSSVLRYAAIVALIELKGDEKSKHELNELYLELENSSDPYLRDLAIKLKTKQMGADEKK